MMETGIDKDDFYNDFSVTIDLSFENYEELFGTSHTHAEKLFDDVGIDSFFEMESSAANSNCQGEFVTEVNSKFLSLIAFLISRASFHVINWIHALRLDGFFCWEFRLNFKKEHIIKAY